MIFWTTQYLVQERWYSSYILHDNLVYLVNDEYLSLKFDNYIH